MKKSKKQIEYEKKFNTIVKKLHGENTSIKLDQAKENNEIISSTNKNYNSHNYIYNTEKKEKNSPKNIKELVLQIEEKKKKKNIKKKGKMIFKNETKLENNFFKLEIHKCLESYLAKIKISDNPNSNFSSISNSPRMIIILDVSGSMDIQVPRFTQRIIPSILNNIYGSNNLYSITLITFESEGLVNVYEGDSVYFSKMKNIYAGGGTNMAQAVDKLYEMFLNKKFNNKIYRILSLSDGELFDQEQTMEAADKLKQLLIKDNYVINSQSIRLFTGFQQPDTRGLSSMLQLSTTGKQMLTDIDCYSLEDNKISKIISDLFINDGLENYFILKNNLNENCLLEEPWSSPKDSIYLFSGINSFWINLKSSKEYICNEIENNFEIILKNGEKYKLKCVLNEDISMDNYQDLIKDKIDYYFKQLKVFKIVNTDDSLQKIDKIIEFFNNLEENIFSRNLLTKNSSEFKLYERTQAIKSIIKRRQMSIANKMREIRNDDKINQLNSKQQADYLRSININDKTGKNLAKRALGGSMDFDGIIREEVKQIVKNINELNSIDELKLSSSFYSTCNTLDGIKAVCSFYHEAKKDNIFEEVTANDILKIINIVGVAANSTIGNYPDPMTYRLKSIYPGTFISLSDILISYEVTGGQNLKEIGTKNEIITAIPFFEDEKLGEFLIKYSPKLLEYSASVGMRRIIAEIPYTNEYTILAGLWAMIPMLLRDKKEIYIKVFVDLCKSYLIAAGDHFKYVIELLDNQRKMDKDGLSIYIGNNGITNMISPILMYLKKNKNKETDELMKRIVRATYQFEVYQYTKKNIKIQKTNDPENYIKKVLIDLLKIDLEKDKVIIPDLFEEVTKEPVFSDKFEINEEKFNEIMNKIWWSDYILVTPLFLKASLSKDPVAEFKNIEINNITENIMQERLGINFSSKLFKLYCIVQSYLQYEQSERIDLKSKKMKIIDLGIKDKAENFVKEFIKNLFKEKYELELREKSKKEKEIISKELAEKIVNSEDISDFISLLKNGIKKGVIEYKLIDHSSLGFDDIIKSIGNKNKEINFRKEKINILITGKDEKDNQIWNEGNKIKSLKTYYPLKNVLNRKEWDDLIKIITKRGKHIYRKNKNRQGHDNKHLSYWAMGFNSIQEMMACVSKKEFEEYAKEHSNCCGFYKGKYTLMRRCDKGMGVTQKRKQNHPQREDSSEKRIRGFNRILGSKRFRNLGRGSGSGRGRGRGRGGGRGSGRGRGRGIK